MADENNIDRLFRDNLYQRDFEFDQSHWKSAEKLIEISEKKRRFWLGRKMLITGIGIVTLLIFAGGYLILTNSSLENSGLSGNKNISENLPTDSGTQEKITAPEKTLLPKENLSNGTIIEKETLSGNSEGETPGSKTEINLSGISGRQKINPCVLHDIKEPGIDGRISTGKEAVSFQNNNTDPEARVEPAHSEKTTETGEVPPAIPDNGEVVQESQNSPAERKTVLAETGRVENGTFQEEMEALSQENIPSPAEGAGETQKTAEPGLKNPESFGKPVITPNNENAGDEENSTEGLVKNQETKSPLKDRMNWLRHVSLGVSGGTSLSQGFLNNGTSRTGFSTTPVGGIRIACMLNEQVDIETGVIYDYRTNVNSKMVSVTSVDISNNVRYYSESNTLSLHYLDFPFHLTYKYGKHSVVLGMHYAQLINTRNEIINSKEVTGNVSTENSTKQWNKNDGRFSSFDLATILGYEYSVSDRLKICGRLNFGLFDVTDDTSFGNSVRDKNNQLRILVDYRFLKY